MSKVRKSYIPKSFESTGISSDTSANIYMSMLLSPAWNDLTKIQKILYLYCKAQLYAEKNKPLRIPVAFTMNQSKWCSLYGLYKKTNARSFYRDMEALIAHGFIRCVQCGSISRTKSVYAFSEMWKYYNTNKFKIEPSDMTDAMRRKARTPQTKQSPAN